MKPAARIGDMHACPMVTPGAPPVPHVGGPVTTGCPTVLIGGMPAARVSDLTTCAGPPDPIILGSITVFIGGMPAARIGDMTSHGGQIVQGCPTVLIGDASGGGGLACGPVLSPDATPDGNAVEGLTLKIRAVQQAFSAAARNGMPLVNRSEGCPCKDV
jgi:uncharacterized Zn-binding protein involved in type VI secretion